jgi:transcriptional regulator with XRE-family HTH domain
VTIPPENRHVLDVIKATMRLLGLSNRDLERQLNLSGSYLSRLFSGDMELRFDHIVALAREMGLGHDELLRLAYPEPREPPGEAAQQIRASLGQSSPAPIDPDHAKLTRSLERALRSLCYQLAPLVAWAAAEEAAPAGEPAPQRKDRPRRRKKVAPPKQREKRRGR